MNKQMINELIAFHKTSQILYTGNLDNKHSYLIIIKLQNNCFYLYFFFKNNNCKLNIFYAYKGTLMYQLHRKIYNLVKYYGNI